MSHVCLAPVCVRDVVVVKETHTQHPFRDVFYSFVVTFDFPPKLRMFHTHTRVGVLSEAEFIELLFLYLFLFVGIVMSSIFKREIFIGITAELLVLSIFFTPWLKLEKQYSLRKKVAIGCSVVGRFIGLLFVAIVLAVLIGMYIRPWLARTIEAV